MNLPQRQTCPTVSPPPGLWGFFLICREEKLYDKWVEVSPLGQKIKESFILKQKPTAAQKEELHRVLPQQFIEMDMDFHKSAGMLAHAAEIKNADVVHFYFYKRMPPVSLTTASMQQSASPGWQKGRGRASLTIVSSGYRQSLGLSTRSGPASCT